MEKIFEDIGIISSFNDIRFLINKMENYINELEAEDKYCHETCELVTLLEEDKRDLNKIIRKLYSDINKLKDILKWFIFGCERAIRENKLSKEDLDNLTSLIDSGNNLMHDLD